MHPGKLAALELRKALQLLPKLNLFNTQKKSTTMHGASKARKVWKRTHILAVVAITMSALSFVATFAAAYIAFRAEERVKASEAKGATVIAADLGDKVELLAKSSDFMGTLLEAFLDAEAKHPESKSHVTDLEIDLLQKGKLLDLKLSTDKLTLLSHDNGDASVILATCASRRDEIEADIENIAAAKPRDWTVEQINTLRVLPYRLHKLSNTCNQAATSLLALMPAAQRKEPLRGTFGELEAAQEYKVQRKNAGFSAELELSGTPDKPKERVVVESRHQLH